MTIAGQTAAACMSVCPGVPEAKRSGLPRAGELTSPHGARPRTSSTHRSAGAQRGGPRQADDAPDRDGGSTSTHRRSTGTFPAGNRFWTRWRRPFSRTSAGPGNPPPGTDGASSPTSTGTRCAPCCSATATAPTSSAAPTSPTPDSRRTVPARLWCAVCRPHDVHAQASRSRSQRSGLRLGGQPYDGPLVGPGDGQPRQGRGHLARSQSSRLFHRRPLAVRSRATRNNHRLGLLSPLDGCGSAVRGGGGRPRLRANVSRVDLDGSGCRPADEGSRRALVGDGQ